MPPPSCLAVWVAEVVECNGRHHHPLRCQELSPFARTSECSSSDRRELWFLSWDAFCPKQGHWGPSEDQHRMLLAQVKCHGWVSHVGCLDLTWLNGLDPRRGHCDANPYWLIRGVDFWEDSSVAEGAVCPL